MHLQKIVLFAALSLSLPVVAHADPVPPFGAASAYNLVALGSSAYAGNITAGVDVTGRVAANGTLTSGSYGNTNIGSNIANDPYGSSADFAAVATSLTPGSTIEISGGGNTYLPTHTGATIYYNDGGHNVTSGSNGLNFTALQSTLQSMSGQLGGIATTGIIRAGNSSLGENPSFTVLQGTAGVNYFTLTALQFATATLDIEVPTGATVIINVQGTNDTLGNAIYLNGTQYHGDGNQDEDILFNFPDATNVDISAGLDASVLAPFALLTDNNGQIDGNFIAAQIDLTGSAEAHNVEFTGIVPTPGTFSTGLAPEPNALALMGTGILGLAAFARRRIKA
jgi:choice-of-anchor A domain-containing protein